VTLTITLTIIDPCEPPKDGVTGSTLDAVTYVPGEEGISFTYPAWTVAPTECVISYVFTTTATGFVTCILEARTCLVEGIYDYTSTTDYGAKNVIVTAISP